MKKKHLIKLILLILISMIILFIVLNLTSVNATPVENNNFSGIGPNIDNNNNDLIKISTIMGNVIGVVQYIGIITSVIMIIFLGINYFTASHSPEEKSKVDQKMQSIFLGTIFVLGATIIVSFISKLVK